MPSEKQIKREIIESERLLESQKRVVKESKEILLGVFNNYIKRPRIDLLQTLCKNCFYLGYEMARYSFYESSVMTNKEKLGIGEKISKGKRHEA